MDCVEDFIKFCIYFCLENNGIEIEYLIIKFPDFKEENGKDLV